MFLCLFIYLLPHLGSYVSFLCVRFPSRFCVSLSGVSGSVCLLFPLFLVTHVFMLHLCLCLCVCVCVSVTEPIIFSRLHICLFNAVVFVLQYNLIKEISSSGFSNLVANPLRSGLIEIIFRIKRSTSKNVPHITSP